MTYYVLDENNNKHEALDKEGVLALLRQAIENGDLTNVDADSAFVSKFKCCVSGTTNYIAFTSQATYNALKAADQLTPNCYYFIIDDTSADDINNKLEEIEKRLSELEFVGLGATISKDGTYATIKVAGLYAVTAASKGTGTSKRVVTQLIDVRELSEDCSACGVFPFAGGDQYIFLKTEDGTNYILKYSNVDSIEVTIINCVLLHKY